MPPSTPETPRQTQSSVREKPHERRRCAGPVGKDRRTYNGTFQFTTSRDMSWVHVDPVNNWAGVLFLTPNAPVSAGTGFFKFQDDGCTFQHDGNHYATSLSSQDMTKWQRVDEVGNVFNRLVLFDSKRFHRSLDYFGTSIENSRLFQVFFFDTE